MSRKHNTNSRHVHPTVNTSAILWSERVPASWRPFVQISRIDSIAGALLFVWPTAWGLLASAYRVRLSPAILAVELPLYCLGSVVLRSAACTWNDVCDKDFDAKVERTKYRPLAAGTMSVYAAMVFLLPQLALLIGLLMLTNTLAFEMGMLSICLWQPIYPLLKRVTYWPQAWLGFVMNWGLFVAWIGNTSTLDIQSLIPLFLGSCCWTMHYDSIYAMQDKEDDVKIGLKSTALLFSTSARQILLVLCIAFITSLGLFGRLNHHGPAYFLLAVLGTAIHLVWQVASVDFEDPKSCFAKFDANGRHVGVLVAGGMFLDYLFQTFF